MAQNYFCIFKKNFAALMMSDICNSVISGLARRLDKKTFNLLHNNNLAVK